MKMVLLILCNIPIVILEYRVSLIRQYESGMAAGILKRISIVYVPQWIKVFLTSLFNSNNIFMFIAMMARNMLLSVRFYSSVLNGILYLKVTFSVK